MGKYNHTKESLTLRSLYTELKFFRFFTIKTEFNRPNKIVIFEIILKKSFSPDLRNFE